jgi:glucan phosphoethanolaminetransferase (alkaline phosphatase superfamily)
MRFYKYLYIIIYRWNFRSSSNTNFSQTNALISVSFIFLFSIMLLCLFAALVLGSPLFYDYRSVKNIIWPLAIFSFAINYIMFSYKGKFKAINDEFELLNAPQKRTWSSIIITYLLCLFLLLSYLSILETKRTNKIPKVIYRNKD